MKKKRINSESHQILTKSHTHTHEVMNTTANGSNQTIYKYI